MLQSRKIEIGKWMKVAALLCIAVSFLRFNLFAQFCTPQTTNYCCGFGITKVTFNTINNVSSNGSAGYQDFTNIQTSVLQGQSYLLTVKCDVPDKHNAKAWIDWNNDFVFDDINELVLDTVAQNCTASVFIPPNAVLNANLRMRISADYYTEPPPSPCNNLKFGQAEDYTVVVLLNTLPPMANFSADQTMNCSGTVQFTDNSTNLPNSWFWDFGDSVTSTSANPIHTYSSSGSYTITLIVSNDFGADTVKKIDYIAVNLEQNLVTASCTPQTLGNISTYGIYSVKFNTINNSSTGSADGYQDFSCTKFTTVTEGSSYNLTVNTGTANSEDLHIWLDMNNDGILHDSEKIFTSLNAKIHSGNILIPTPSVFDVPLRMRLISESVGNNVNSCSNPFFGQAEDYGVTIKKSVSPPIGDFSADSTNTCTGVVSFSDQSLNVPETWLWDFGDGFSDTIQNPTHTYASNGMYTVSLTVSNSMGTHTKTKNNYIHKSSGFCFVGEEEMELNGLHFLVYPNPGEGVFSFQNSRSTYCQIKIFDVFGKEKFYYQGINTQEEISLSFLPNGVYFLLINADGKTSSQKIVIQ